MSKIKPCTLQFVATDLSEPPWIPGAYPRDAMDEANDSDRCAAPDTPGSASSEFDCPELTRSASLTPDGSPSSQRHRPPSNWPSATRLLLSHANIFQLSTDEPGIGGGKNDNLVPGLAPSLPFAMNVDNGIRASDHRDSIKLTPTEADESVVATLNAASDPGSSRLTRTATREAACPNSLLDGELPGSLASRSDESWRLIQHLREHGILPRAAPMDHDDPSVVNDPSGILSIVSAWSRSFFDALSQLRTSKSSLAHGDRSGRASPCRTPGLEYRPPASSTWSGNSSCYDDAVQYQTDHILPLEFFEFPDQSCSWKNDKYLHTWLDAQLSVSEDVNLASKDAESPPTPPQAQGTASESSSKANDRADTLGEKILHPESASSPEIATTTPEEEEVPGSEGKIPELDRSTDKENVVSIREEDQSSEKGKIRSTGEADLTPGKGLLPENRDVVVSKSDTGTKSALPPTQALPLPKQASTPKKKGAACQQGSQPGKPQPAQAAKAKNTPSPTQAPGQGEKPPVVKEKAKAAQKTPTQPRKTKTQPAQKGKQGGKPPKKGPPQQTSPPKKGTTCPPPPPTGKTAAAQKPGSKPAATGPAPAPAPKPQNNPPPPPPPKAPSPPKPNPAPPPNDIPQFTGKVIIEQNKPALLYATLASSSHPPSPFGPHHLTLYSDASWSHSPTSPPKASMAIVHRPSPTSPTSPTTPWSETAYTISASRRGRQSYCEILAIEAALGIAKTAVQRSCSGAITRVTVFSDARPALDAIGKPRRAHTDCFARGAAYSVALAGMGVEVEVRWVPGHCGVEGNERADAVARLARVYGPDPDAGGGVPRTEEPRVMRLSVAVLRGVAGLLGAMRGMVGGATAGMGGVEEKVAGWLGRAAREEGWVVDCNEEGEGFG